MTRIPFLNKLVPVKLVPAALAAALVLCASLASAQDASYYQNVPPEQNVPGGQNAADQNASQDPPDRVARLAFSSGDVELAPAGESDWGTADINRPLSTGDRLLTGSDGRAALELGDAALRINDGSAFNFLDLNDTTTQVELTQGTLNLRVRRLGDGQTYEVDTPAVAFVANQPGTYRVDVAPDGNGAMVTVFEGAGTVYGENGVSRPVQAGQSFRFNDTALTNVNVQPVPAPDAFDRFCSERDSRYANSVSRRYVAPEVIGYDDLDQYGDWQDSSDYGQVWYPTHVAADWAPYRDGHWAWIEPWGWTWVDNEPWGFAPFHYGRWAYVRNRWGWIPGQRVVRPVYAPALVAFVGGGGLSLSINIGGGEPIGWFPLGPRDVYVPPYRASRGYFTSINVTNIRNVYVNKTVINNYYGSYASGHRYTGGREYAYRGNPHAFTAVPRNVFVGARPVRAAVLHVNPAALAKASMTSRPHITPTRESLGIRAAKRPIAAPVERSFQRTVVARHAPPPRPVPFAAREKLISRQGGAPLPVAQLHQLRQQRAQAQPQSQRVHVIAAKPGNPHAAAGKPPVMAPGRNPPTVEAPRRGQPNPPHQANAIHPIQAPINRSSGAAAHPQKAAPLRAGELPSARFAHPNRGAAPPNTANNPATRDHAAQAQQHAAQQQSQNAQQRAAVAAQEAQSHDAQKQQAMARQQSARAQQDKQNAQQARQRADQSRAGQSSAAQREAQASQNDQRKHAQQDQQQAQQQRQRADQAQQEQQQAQQHRNAQAAQQQAQQHAADARQRDKQMRAQQDQQRADQARGQQEQQRAQQEQQHQAQVQQQRNQQVQQQRNQQVQQQRNQQVQQQRQTQEAQSRTQQQHAQHPQNQPPPQKAQHKNKDKDQEDHGH